MPRSSSSEALPLDPLENQPQTVGPPVVDDDPEEQLKLQRLESHLWEAANILRGKIDSSDFKNYILGLLFFKRMSDVWEEEDEHRVLSDKDVEHRFEVPILWKSVREHGPKIRLGQRLNKALAAIEKANGSNLAGVFQDVDFDNQKRVPPATLENLFDHFEQQRLRIDDYRPDVLGRAYMFLIGRFADDAGKKGGEFYTPPQVAQLIVECLLPEEGMRIYDPACGSGGLLLQAGDYLWRYKQEPRSLRLFGQEMNVGTWGLCQFNFVIHAIDDADVLCGDTLRDPLHKNNHGKLKKFDRVLANPPFSLRNWGYEAWQDGDLYGRDCYGCPPPSYGDLAFVQHMLASLESDGRLGVVVPNGVLFRGGAEGKIRRGLLEDDLVEAVISLGPNLFYGTSIPACVMVINRQKHISRRERVLLVDGFRQMQAGKNKNYLSRANVEWLAEAFHSFSNTGPLNRVVTLDEIAGNDFNLTIGRYVSAAANFEEPRVDVIHELRELRRLQDERDAAESELARLLAELGYDG